MLDAPGKLGKILVGMNKALGEIPLTVKLRTGVKYGRNTSHKLMPRLGPEWGAAALTVRARLLLFWLVLKPFAVAWPNEATTLLQTSRLGLYQTMCTGSPREGGRGRGLYPT